MSKAKVFIVDDDGAVRTALSRLLRAAGCDVETFASADAFLARDAYAGPGCLVLDVQMKGLTGMELQGRLAAGECELPIVFLTAHGDIPMSVEAMKQGAVDFLTKPVDESLLLPAVRAAIEQSEARHAVRERVAALTRREFEVMRCVLTGALNKQIAAHLGIAEKTVKIHRGRVMSKMGVPSVAELVRMCDLAGIPPANLNGSSSQ